MLKQAIKFLFIISTLIAVVHTECSITKEPRKVMECLGFITSALYSAIAKDVAGLCEDATKILDCMKEEIKGCIAEKVGNAALKEAGLIAEHCCPSRNNPNCPIRDENIKSQRCFAADSLVTLTNGKQKQIIELQSGDQIIAYDDKTNQIISTQVLTMLDYQPNQYATFKQITTNSGRQLSLTSSHLLPTDVHGFVMAKNIRQGMNIYVINDDGLLTTETVLNIIDVVKQGYVAPLTKQGTLVVNNIAASCYATIDNHHLAHVALAPVRWWFSIFSPTEQAEKIIGIHWFPKMLYELIAFFIPSIIQN